MDRFLYLITSLAILPLTMQDTIEEGSCECAVFPVSSSEFIIKRATQFNVTCNAQGQGKCQNLCVILAGVAKGKAAQTICEKLETRVERLQVELRAKICNTTKWSFAGLKSTNPICCNDGKSIPCEEISMINH